MLILNHKVLLNKWKSFTVAYFKIYYSKSLFIKYDELCTYINYWKSAFFYKMKNNFAKSIVYLQSQKQLYNHQCPFICLSLGLGCTDCDEPIWAPLHFWCFPSVMSSCLSTGCPKKNVTFVRLWVFDLGRGVFRGKDYSRLLRTN